MLCLDRSGSMGASGLGELKSALLKVLGGASSELPFRSQ